MVNRPIAINAYSGLAAVVDEHGIVYTKGSSSKGGLGNGSGRDEEISFTRIWGYEDYRFDTITIGTNFMVALQKETGRLYAWGANDNGQLGNGTNKNAPVLSLVKSKTSFTQVSAGSSHVAALDTNGHAWLWGKDINSNGEYTYYWSGGQNIPAKLTGNHVFKTIAAGTDYTVAIDQQGQAWAWGRNDYGQLGDGTNTDRHTPVRVAGNHQFTAIAAGYSHTVALDTQGQAWAWGNNDDGQLGDGTHTNRSTPVRVLGGHKFTAKIP